MHHDRDVVAGLGAKRDGPRQRHCQPERLAHESAAKSSNHDHQNVNAI
jgi:hypothetical protein